MWVETSAKKRAASPWIQYFHRPSLPTDFSFSHRSHIDCFICHSAQNIWNVAHVLFTDWIHFIPQRALDNLSNEFAFLFQLHWHLGYDGLGAGEEGGAHGGDVERALQPQHLQLLLCRRRRTAHHQVLKGHATLLVFHILSYSWWDQIRFEVIKKALPLGDLSLPLFLLKYSKTASCQENWSN